LGPRGGTLVDRLVSHGAAREALVRSARGFVERGDDDSIITDMCLASGAVAPIPLALSGNELSRLEAAEVRSVAHRAAAR
jgi:ATP sulfurylase